MIGGSAIVALLLCAVFAGSATARAEQTPPRLVSEIKDLRFIALDKLPAVRDPNGRGDDCSSHVIQPQSEAAHMVAAQGWRVTGDESLGRYRAVSFASNFEDGTSGTCFVHDGNVGIFEGGRLVALIYGHAGDDAIGRVVARQGGGVRIADGDIGGDPVGDLSMQADGTLLLSRLPTTETTCGGSAMVPNIRRIPIDKARAALVAKGWAPVQSEHSTNPREQALAARGIVEISKCDLTGLAYCEFRYTGPAGMLSVTTVGDAETPEVSDYTVQCR